MRPQSALVVVLVLAGLSIAACNADVDVIPSSPAGTPTPPTFSPTSPTPTPPDTEPYPASSEGFAISWPQCGALYPDSPYDFGIVGITDGRAFTHNPCFADEYRWAERARYHPSIYMNTNYIESEALESEAPESNRSAACARSPRCLAYQYGWASAEDAYDYAADNHALAPVWWLDVQIASDWSADQSLNARAIQGAGDFLRSHDIRVGISSTSYQWAEVTGGSPHHLGIWDASALDADEAAQFCRDGKDFAGGSTEQIAYVGTFETVLACGRAGALTSLE